MPSGSAARACSERARLTLHADAEHAVYGEGTICHGDLVVMAHLGTCSTCRRLADEGRRHALDLLRASLCACCGLPAAACACLS